MEFLKKLQNLEQIFVAVSRATNMPFVTCDEETYNDQIWIFADQESLEVWGQKQQECNHLIQGGPILQKSFLGFYVSLYNMGINEVVFTERGEVTGRALNQIVLPPDYSKMPAQQVPTQNPLLQLSALYFLQELRKPIPAEEKENLKELEEELAINLVRSRYMIPLKIYSQTEKDDGKNVQVVTVKNNEGDVLQPVFTDSAEFNKFNKENEFKAVVVEFANFEKMLIPDSKGIVLNPMGFHLILTPQQLPQLVERFSV